MNDIAVADNQSWDACSLRGKDLERDALLDRLRSEEFWNSLTHGVGFVVSVLGSIWLSATAVRVGDIWQLAACGVYGASLVAVYAASTLSHIYAWHPRLRHLYRRLDQAFIFLLIVGTFTPIAITYLRHGWWLTILPVMWLLAWTGFFLKAVRAHQVEAVTTGAQVALGWLPVLTVQPMFEFAPRGLLILVLAGGLCYTAGIFFLQRDSRYRHFHAIWHIFVIAGSACHFYAILTYCTSAPVAGS